MQYNGAIVGNKELARVISVGDTIDKFRMFSATVALKVHACEKFVLFSNIRNWNVAKRKQSRTKNRYSLHIYILRLAQDHTFDAIYLIVEANVYQIANNMCAE